MMRQILGVAIGVVIGIAGASLFRDSLRPPEGSAAERAEHAERALQHAELRIAELEAASGLRPGERGVRTSRDEARAIIADLRAGRRVDLEDVYAAMKPALRDLAPLLDRMRQRDQKRHFDRIAGEMARKYSLTEDEERELQEWLERKGRENASRYLETVTAEDATLEDMIRATRDERMDDGLDGFMETVLKGDDLSQFREDRMRERVERVQAEADRKLHRLDSIVGLDEQQKDEVFALMARSSRDFDSAMQFDGIDGGDPGSLRAGDELEAAVLGRLRPDQQAAFDAHRQAQRDEAERELAEIGLKLPEDWDVFDHDGF